MTRFGGVAALAAGVVLLAGCGLGGEGAATTVTETASSSSSSTSTTTSAEATPEQGPASEATTTTVPWSLGEYAENEFQKTSVLAVEEASSERSQLPADQQWWKVRIETCALAELEGETVTAGWSPWGIQGDDGGSYPSSNITWGDFPRPQYPFGADPIPLNECRKGWVMVAVNAGVAPAAVTYSPNGVSGTSWTIE